MTVPSVMFIEMAKDSLKTLADAQKVGQQKELTSFGDVRAQEIGATGLSNDFRKGYELGLQTMRVLIAQTFNPKSL